MSPLRTFLTISPCCFTRFCCGRRIRKYMITKIGTNGSSEVSMSAAAKRGTLGVGRRNQHSVCLLRLAWSKSRSGHTKTGADYSHGRTNCNVAGKAPQPGPKPLSRATSCGAKATRLRVRRNTKTDRHGRKNPARHRGPLCDAKAHRRSARTAEPAPARHARPRRRRCLRVASGRAAAGAGPQGQSGRNGPVARDRPGARRADGQYRAVRARAARQQRAAVGRARHGQIVAGQGLACVDQCAARQGRLAQADRDPPRGHREPAGTHDAAARRAASG